MALLKVHVGDKAQIISAPYGEMLTEVFRREDIFVPTPCGGRGSCGRCKIRIREGGEEKEVLACQTPVGEDAEIFLLKTENDSDVVIHFSEEAPESVYRPRGGAFLNAAVEIQAETIGILLVDPEGNTFRQFSAPNPQTRFGKTERERIRAAEDPDQLLTMAQLLRQAIDELLHEYTVDKITICGSSPMIHLFLGVDPSGLLDEPPVSAVTEERALLGEEVGISVRRVVVLPSASARIGSHVSCALLADYYDQCVQEASERSKERLDKEGGALLGAGLAVDKEIRKNLARIIRILRLSEEI